MSAAPVAGGRRRSARADGDAGSSLLLFPAAILIVLLLGAIAVDLAAVQLAKRDALDLAASAANDAATAGLDQARFRTTGEYVVDPVLARDAVERSVAANDPSGATTVIAVTVGPDAGQVTVEVSATATPVFAPALPGWDGPTTVTASATATAVVP